MKDNVSVQKDLFEMVRQRLAPNLSLAHEISLLLNISYDSAYRRIRGDQFLSLDELIKICSEFHISMDNICNSGSQNVSFDYFSLDPEKYRFKDWVNRILADMKIIKESSDKSILYSSKDPPIYHYFVIPEIIAFKAFLWEKTVFQFPEYADRKFSFDFIDSEIIANGRMISKLGTKIPTTELWNEHTLLLTMKQIEYYWIAGLFQQKDDLLNLLDKVEKWIYHLRNQAQYGFKYLYDEPAEGIENSYMLYETEIILNDNLILVTLGDKNIAYLAVNSLNMLRTTNPGYCQNVKEFLYGLILSSNLISHSGEKERNRFFNKHLYLLEEFRKRIG